jgi:hypothetical protein
MSENQDDSKLMCSAHGCPNRWTVNMGRPLCSAHQWADPADWGAVTAKLNGMNLVKPSYYEPKDEF